MTCNLVNQGANLPRELKLEVRKAFYLLIIYNCGEEILQSSIYLNICVLKSLTVCHKCEKK